MNEFDKRFSSIMIEINALGKSYSNREVALKVMRALPREWDVNTVAMRESKDLNKIELHDLFVDIKAYEFELGVRTEEDTSTSQVTKALTASDEIPAMKTAEKISSDAISSFKPKEPAEENRACYNCGKEGHFIADCTKPKKDEKRTSYKKNSREERKRFSRKKEQKALLADESNNKWAESDSTSSDSETSSSESGDEANKCLMANDADIPDDGEVLDFTSDEFSKEDLINALNNMVNEYHMLSHKFDEVRTNRKSSTDKSDQSNSDEYTGSDSLKAQISLLMTENNDMRSQLQETLSENQILTDLVNSWNKASISLDKLTGMQKQAGDKSGLGYSMNEGSSSISTTQSFLENNNFKSMKFHNAQRSLDESVISKGRHHGKPVNKNELIKKTVWYLDSGCSRHMT
ncbi:uncharacterized protein [Henckelia pumila]|uniref:uncharacterized protein n=1 Tax=Henckelia pumila TaxID=405737 RepID=UPI003C6E2F70